MLPVEILPVQETIVLRARGSELLILPTHVKKLKALVKPRDFSQYFRDEALVNRPARKLFEAWLRKDHTLWTRLYQTVHKEMELSDDAAASDDAAEHPAASRASARNAEPEEHHAAPAAKAAKAASVKDDEPEAKKSEKKAKAPAKAEKKPKAEEKVEKKAKAPAKDTKAKAEAKPDKKAKTGAKKKG